MTDEEADALDELLTQTTVRLTNIPGVFARQRALLGTLDEVAAKTILLQRRKPFIKRPLKLSANWSGKK
jgi:hypothetical protein